MTHKTILVIGQYDAGFEPHDRLLQAIEHASAEVGVVVNTRWVGNDELASRPGVLSDAAGVILAPRAAHAYRVFPEATVRALRAVRDRGVPFLATGDSHDLVLVEVARNVMGLKEAGSRFFDEDAPDPVVKEIVRRRQTGRRGSTVDLLVRSHPVLLPFLGPSRREECVDLSHAVNLDYASALEEAGLRAAGVDALSGVPHLFVFEPNAWHVSAAFLPQLLSTDGHPHPLFVGFLSHVAGAAGSVGTP